MAKKAVQQLDMFAAFAEPTPPPTVAKEQPRVFVEMPTQNENEPVVIEATKTERIAAEPIEEIQQIAEPVIEFVEEASSVVDDLPQQPELIIAAKSKPVQHITRRKPITKLPSKRGRKSFKEMDAEVDLIEVPTDDELSKKLYYSISEVAGWFKVNASLIRAWENEFDILKPRKNRKGDRLFRAEDVKNLRLIYYLLRNRKFSVDGAKKYLRTNRKAADTNLHLIQSLNKFKGFLLELKANLST